MKKNSHIVLAVLLLSALGMLAYADDTASPKTQLQLIDSQIDSLKQDDSTRVPPLLRYGTWIMTAAWSFLQAHFIRRIVRPI